MTIALRFYDLYSERTSNVSACFCHFILVFHLMNDKDRTIKARVNIFR